MIIYLSLVAATCGFLACSDAPPAKGAMENKVDNAMEDVGQAKEEVAKEMRDLREMLAVRLAKVEAKLQDPALKAEQRTEWEGYKVEVNDQMARLDNSLGDVERASNETWADVKKGTRETTDDVGNWFQRQAEKIDRETKADGDKDGH